MEVCFTYLLALNFFSGAYQQFKNCKFQLVLPAFSELSRQKKMFGSDIYFVNSRVSALTYFLKIAKCWYKV